MALETTDESWKGREGKILFSVLLAYLLGSVVVAVTQSARWRLVVRY